MAAASETDPYLTLLKKCLTASLYAESAWYEFRRTPRRNPNPPRKSRPVRDRLNDALVKFLAHRSMKLFKVLPYEADKRELGQDWPCFGYTMVGIRRLDNLQFCVEEVLKNNVPGDLIETGVWRGGCVAFMRAVLRQHGVTDRVVWAADSFEGMPSPNAEAYPDDSGADLTDVDILKVSLDQVKANLRLLDLLDDQVRFLKGWFSQTLPGAPIERLALLRLDGDLYESTMDALSALYPRLSPGGYVIVDDYLGWPMCRKAVDGYLAEQNIKADIKSIDGSAVYWQVTGRD
jgi:O-methyltransferase